MRFHHALLFVLIVTLFAAGQTPLFSQEEGEATGYCRLKAGEKLWSGPGENFKVVRNAPAGLLLEIIGEKKEYFRVRVFDGFRCYVYEDYLEVDDHSMGTVKGDHVNLRSIPRIEGDYPIFQVDSGTRFMVWDRVGGWYLITAPEEAYLYVLKDSVNPVEPAAEVDQEIVVMKNNRRKAWEAHKADLQTRRMEEDKAQALQAGFTKLEASEAQGFQDMDLNEALEKYKEIAASATDPTTRKLAEARIAEIEALLEREKAIAELKEREKAWRAEREAIKDSMNKEVVVKPEPATHDNPGKGREVRIIGLVDAAGSEVVLRGGKSLLDVLYKISCPDGRYILPDFHGKRISVSARMGDVPSKEGPPAAVVERIEILN